MSAQLSDERLPTLSTKFEQDGYVVLPEFFAGAAFEELQENLARYIRDVVPSLPASKAFFENPGDPATLKQMQYMQDHDQYFADLLHGSEQRRLAESLLGEPVIPQGAEFFNKPPRIGKVTPPHQDGYYFCLVPNRAVTLWIALEAVDQENGCLRYVAGSHRDGVRPHGSSNVLGFSQGLADWGPNDEAREVMQPLQAGDMLAHHSLTVHRADANTSDRTRRALGLVYYGESAQVDPQAQQRYKDSMALQHESLGVAEQ